MVREGFLEEATFYPRQREQHVQKSCDMLEESRKAAGYGVPEKGNVRLMIWGERSGGA